MRAEWDTYFLGIARAVATRGTCDRRRVGAVVVRERRILATGYNGSIRGLPHCDDAGTGHLMEDGHCVRTVHAEANAIAQAAALGVEVKGSTVYLTDSPCWKCFQLVANAGIVRIVFLDLYPETKIYDAAKAVGIELVHVEGVVETPDAERACARLREENRTLKEALRTTANARDRLRASLDRLAGLIASEQEP